MNLSINQRFFLDLLKAGLWETGVQLSKYDSINYLEIYEFASGQAAVGLVTAGVEHDTDVNVPKDVVLQFVGTSVQFEQRNKAMNAFIAEITRKLHNHSINFVLVKGQGVAQCYERPLWRACGDVDLLLDIDNYEKAKAFLKPLADDVAEENVLTKHQALTIKGFDVELHGRMPFMLSKRADEVIDEVINGTTSGGQVRIWKLKESEIKLPSVDNDVILVFIHYLHHFFIEGVGLRQICDWCRLLWTYRTEINVELLEHRIQKMGLMTEWKVFASLAVNTLGMPVEAMPFYDSRFNKKGERVLERVLKSGNMGHNKDLSYRVKYKGMAYKVVSLWRRFCDFASFVPIFPMDSPMFFMTYVVNKTKGSEE